ncbi:protocadherin Fat 3-like isoform X2 [Dreissena polymorpha]|uniref:protocadherin Fat 3-like isoform X2 n=1 Tax=Dreissena polymorpha TaxID=45954 RepID=UPI0022654DEC|nr:protocadherin Fat 3-like isoform X2 [Dreissena polymorpha]
MQNACIRYVLSNEYHQDFSSWMLIATPLPSGVFTSFTKPSNGDSRASCRENINVNTSIYEVKHASSIGFIVTIQTQKPPLPSFQLVKGSYNWNLTTPAMIDRETTPQFTFEFSATDGSLSELSVPLTLDIEDENDNTPQFINSIYTGTIYNTAKAGDYMLTIQATDEDLNPNITYFITGGDIGNTFSLDQYTGQLTLTRPGNLNPVTTPTYTLTVQASDGKTFNTTTVTVHVVADPCSSNPCNNGGACAVNGMAFTCSCTTGFHGSTCNETGPTTSDPCVSKPCTNGCTCAVSGPSFSCLCVSGTMGNTCSPIVTTAAAQNETLDQENKAESSSNLLAVYIVVPMLMLSIIVVAAIVMYKNKKRWLKVYKTKDS